MKVEEREEDMDIIVMVGQGFSLERVVCNHGFFMMHPNYWNPSCKSLFRPLQLEDTSTTRCSVLVSITQHPTQSLLCITLILPTHHHIDLPLSLEHKQSIEKQVRRMFRISPEEELIARDFCHLYPGAQFDRIFRSPTLFEDMVKSILLCNCTWARSLDMARALCNLPRPACCIHPHQMELYSSFNFPTPKDIACLNVDTINEHCNLGYRAAIILQLARDIKNGKLNLGILDRCDHHHVQSLHKKLNTIKGFGPFTIANIMMCIGFYHKIPIDTETIKHIKQVHEIKEINKKNQEKIIEQIYGKYAPFQCMVYWVERVQYYEKKLGKLSELSHSQYGNVTSRTTNNFEISSS